MVTENSVQNTEFHLHLRSTYRTQIMQNVSKLQFSSFCLKSHAPRCTAFGQIVSGINNSIKTCILFKSPQLKSTQENSSHWV